MLTEIDVLGRTLKAEFNPKTRTTSFNLKGIKFDGLSLERNGKLRFRPKNKNQEKAIEKLFVSEETSTNKEVKLSEKRKKQLKKLNEYRKELARLDKEAPIYVILPDETVRRAYHADTTGYFFRVSLTYRTKKYNVIGIVDENQRFVPVPTIKNKWSWKQSFPSKNEGEE